MNTQANPGEIPGRTPDFILSQLWTLASADLKPRRTCCRCCWGQGHDWQRTPREYRLHLESGGKPEGGPGYNALKPPHPDCPECFGQGIPAEGRPAVSAAAKLRALDLLGRHHGLFKARHRPQGRFAQDAQCREDIDHLRIAREVMLASGEPQDEVDHRLETHHPETWRLLQLDDALRLKDEQDAGDDEELPEGVYEDRSHRLKHVFAPNAAPASARPLTPPERRARADYALDVLTPQMLPFELNAEERHWFAHRAHRPFPVPRRIMDCDFRGSPQASRGPP